MQTLLTDDLGFIRTVLDLPTPQKKHNITIENVLWNLTVHLQEKKKKKNGQTLQREAFVIQTAATLVADKTHFKMCYMVALG